MNLFSARYAAIFGEDILKYEGHRLQHSIWMTKGKVTAEETITRLRKEGFAFSSIPFSPNGYIVTKAPHSIGAMPSYLLGYYSVQEAASQFPAVILNPQPEEFVIDMCAAPGMKTIQMATLMQNKGTIISCDAKKERLAALQNNLERCGIANCIVLHEDSRRLRLKENADKVLLDAPCSGNFFIDNKWLAKRKPSDFRKMAALQRELLATGISLLKKNGTLVYSTCSFEPEENEEVIDWAIRTLHVSLEPVTATSGICGLTRVLGKNLSPELKKTWRFMPPDYQAFFIAKLKKAN